MPYVLRPDQADGYARLREATGRLIASGQPPRLIYVAPTGAGKTVTATYLIQQALERTKGTIWFMAPRRELVDQAAEKLTANKIRFGFIMAGRQASMLARVQVVSKDTVHRRVIQRGTMDKPPQPALIIADEMHLTMSPSWQEVFGLYPESPLIGLTATPADPRGRGLGPFWQDMVIGATYEELIKIGALVPTRVFAPDTATVEAAIKDVRTTAGEYKQDELGEAVNKTKLIGDMVSTWQRIASDRITLAFGTTILHSMAMRDAFRDAGVAAEHVDGEMPNRERDELMKAFREGKIPVLTNCLVASYGFDAPICSCAIIARPTKSLVLWRQMAGRPGRPHPLKTDAYVIDHAGAIHRHGFPDEDLEWSLDGDGTVQERQQESEKSPLPIVCQQCGFAFARKHPTCPNCGWCVPRKESKVQTRAGLLAEIERKKVKKVPKSDHEKLWKNCLGLAIGMNRKIGFACHRFREEAGIWPPKTLRNVPRGKEESNMLARDFYQLKTYGRV